MLILFGILLGFNFAAWLFTLLAIGYGGYRYVYCPWVVMRKDLVAAAAEFTSIRQELKTMRETLKLGSVKLTDAQLAFVEKDLERKDRVRRSAQA
jgi:hypothetical protein